MLLVLNLIAVAGFVLFLAKCRPIAVRSGDAFHEIRPRAEAANLSAHSASPIQDAVLKRLSLLEDIVYRQLNGKEVRRRLRGLCAGGPGTGEPLGPFARWGRAGASWLPQAPSHPFLPCLGREAGAAGKNYLLLLCPSCKFAFIVETCQYSWLRVPACGNHYLATPARVQKLVARPTGTGGAGRLGENSSCSF